MNCLCTAFTAERDCPYHGKWIKSREPKTDIVLAVMEKNEKAVLPRLFESVKGFVKSAVVLDTGSDDGTWEWLQDPDVAPFPLSLHRSSWKGFGPSRTELSRLAVNKADWILFLDADDTIQFEDDQERPLKHRALELDPNMLSYFIRHTSGPQCFYYLPRICRGNHFWAVVGRCHEYLVGTGGSPILKGISILHHNDGTARGDKFKRNLELLLQDYDEDRFNPRTVFYLANTYRDLGMTSKAITFFKMRADMGGWDEEVFYSKMEAARLAGSPAEMMDAWFYRPSRAEPLLFLAQIMTAQGKLAEAHAFATARKALPLTADVLFVDRSAYG